jgi:hypothetical protein
VGAAPLMAALSPLDINPVTGAGTISERRP